MSRNSVVGIATDCELDDPRVGVRVPVGSKIFSSPRPVQWASGALSPEVKRIGREVDHSPPASVEVNKIWIYVYTSIPLNGVLLN
jgi:hypothetical protein